MILAQAEVTENNLKSGSLSTFEFGDSAKLEHMEQKVGQ